jgi:hypothetical protein
MNWRVFTFQQVVYLLVLKMSDKTDDLLIICR